MKRNLLLLIVLCCTMSMMAQNGKISYQAVVRDSENKLVHDTELQVTVALANSATGAAVYSELHNVTSNANGLISLLIGDSDEVLPGSDWNAVQWNTAWVTATIRKASDQTFLAEHHLPLSAVPYALYADEVDTLFLQNYLTTHDYGNDDYVTHEQLNDTLAAYYDTTQVKTAIHDTADALRAMMGDAAYNSKITLKKNNVELDSFRLNQQTDKAINIPVPTTVAELSDAGNYVTKTKLNDTLGAYYDTANVKQMLKPYLKANELCDSIVKCDVIKDMRDSLGNAFDTLKYYTTSDQIDTLLKNYVKGSDLCDSIENNCTNVALKNKDNLFTYRNQFDSTVFFKNETQFDSIAYFNERTYFDKDVNIDGDVIFKGYNYYYNVNNFYEHDAIVLIDEAVNPNTLGPVQSTQDNTLNRKLAVNYNDLMVVYDTLKKQEHNDNAALSSRIVADSNRLVEFKGKVHNDSLALAERIDTIYRHLCDSVMNCTDIKTMQTDIAANKTNIGLNKQAIIDSSAHIRNEIKNGQITIAVNRSTTTTETTVTNPTFGVNQGTDQTVTINIPQETTVNNGQLTIVAAGDTTRFTANQATNDTVRLDKFATKDTLSKYTTTDKIDTIVNKHHFLTSDSALIVRMRDSIQKVNAHVSADSLVLATKIHDDSLTLATKIYGDSLTLATKLHADSVDLAKHISDSTRMVFDTLHTYYATKDTLKNFVNKLAIRDSVNKVVTDSLRKGSSEMTRAIDSIARHHISDSTRMVFDTLHKYYATKDTLKNFVNKLAIRDSVNKIVKDSLRIGTSAINIAIDTIARHNIHDTAVAIRNSIGNGTLTIQKNGTTVGTFTANQSTDQPVNVNITVPTAVTDLSDAADYAKINGNTFTGTHNFNNASITVPSNTDAIKRPVPATTPAPDCNNMNAVNVCDLLAVFDSLTKRIDSLSAELAALKSAVPPVFNSLVLSDSTTTTMKATANFSSPSAAITSYIFRYSINSDMSSATEVDNGNSNVLSLTGLTPYKRYYVTVTATNLAGSTTSSIVNGRTLANAPTATFTNSSMSPKPLGFQVTVSDLNFMEPEEGTVQIFYKEGSDCTADESGFIKFTPESGTITTNEYTQIISGSNFEANTSYCVMVKVCNVDDTTAYGSFNTTSGGEITLDINNGTINLCGKASADATFTATPSSGEVTDYNYIWTVGNSSEVEGNPALLTFTSSGEQTVTCQATHNTFGYTVTGTKNVTVAATGTAPTFKENDEGFEVHISDLTDADKFNWGDGSADIDNPSASLTKTFTSSKALTITATNSSSGCTTTKKVAVGHATWHPCTVVNKNDNEGGTATSIDSVRDIDGTWYSVVEIGNRCWMAENLRVTHYETENAQNEFVQGGAVTVGNPGANIDLKNSHGHLGEDFLDESVYGFLYNWSTTVRNAPANPSPDGVQGICPHGWHVPSQAEWTAMLNSIGNDTRKLTTGWHWYGSYHQNLTSADRNSTGFRAIPVGTSAYGMETNQPVDNAWFWTTTTYQNGTTYSANGANIRYGYTTVSYGSPMGNGIFCSVRCIRDTVQLPTLSITLEDGFPGYCAGQPTTITYAATLSDASQQDEYNYTWTIYPLSSSVPYTNFVANGNTCEVTYVKPSESSTYKPNSYTYIVKCVASKGSINLVDEYQQVVNANGNYNLLAGCNINVDTLTVLLTSRPGVNDGYTNGISSDYIIDWGDGTSQVGPASTTTSGPQHTYAASGTYPITIYTSVGCPRTRSVTVKAKFDTHTPCTGSAHQDANYQNNGLNGTMNDGYEYNNTDEGISAVTDYNGIVAVTDYDGNIYPVVKIGNQCWMKENLRCAHSPQTGTNILNPLGVSGNNFTSSKKSKVAQWYLNDKNTSVSLRYGLYYNWCAAMDIYSGNEVPESGQDESYWSYTASANHRGICPKGWHIPTQSELNTLVSAAGGGNAMAGSFGWHSAFSNSSDFTAVPSGEAAVGDFHNSGQMSIGDIYAFYWSATELSTDNSRAYPLRLSNGSVGSPEATTVSTSTEYTQSSKDYGFSVRCVRDE